MKKAGVLIIVLGLLVGCGEKNTNTPSTKLFTKISHKKSGIDFVNQITEDKTHNHIINDMFISGAGVAIGDINNDTLPDLFFTGNQVQDRLYLNKGNLEFEDITETAGILDDGLWSTGVTFVDINNDGLQDIYVCRSVQENDQLSGNQLYINQGDLTFKEQAAEFGLADRGLSIQASFADFDLDGRLDVYIVNQPPSRGQRAGLYNNRLNPETAKYTDRLYWNKGEDGFEDVTEVAGLLSYGFGFNPMVGDYNHDGYPDIYVTNDYDRPDRFFVNQRDGTFRDYLSVAVKHTSNFSMGSDAADYNNDGLLDIMVVDMVAEDHKRIKTNMGGMNPRDFWDIVNKGWHYQYMFNTLQKNNGNNTFSEVAQIGGVSNTDWSWGPLFADFDNDGWKDLFVTNGVNRNQRYSDLQKKIKEKLDSLEVIANQRKVPLNDLIDVMEFIDMAPVDRLQNYIYKNNGDLTFSKKIEDWGFEEPGLSYGAAYADLDNDGDQDLVINNIDELAQVYRNNTVEQGKGNFLRIAVKSEGGNPFYQSKVILYKGEDLWQFIELTNVRGYMSKSEDVAHFGLGAEELVEKVEIIFPDGKHKILENVNANQYLDVIHDKNLPDRALRDRKSPPFKEITKASGIDFVHQENSYNDYRKEILLPHKMSNFGPGIAVGDVNKDGYEDFYVGGAAGFDGQLYLQKDGKSFKADKLKIFSDNRDYEDMDAAFFDADLDGDLDLYIVSGGNEFEAGSSAYQDRLYLNNGTGRFVDASNRLPEITISGSCVRPYDMDQDGDLDLFIGGRLVPGNYPRPSKSLILRNDGGKFTDITADVAPGFMELGLVTDAVWSDQNGDGKADIVVTGEWMPVRIFEQQDDGTFEDQTELNGLGSYVGWFYGLEVEDIDKDGDEDIIAGNLGLNYKYKASEEEPFEVYSMDFDGNGSLDIVLSYYEHGHAYPLRGRSCSSQQIPTISEEFPTFESFGEADLTDVYGEDLESALSYQATSFASAVILNQGNQQYSYRPLPNEAQLSSINNLIVEDFNKDGNMDLLISGNLYSSEIETPRNDAGMGLYLEGNGKGDFSPVPLMESGFFAPHDAKDMKLIEFGGQHLILVANNNFKMQAILHQAENSSVLSSQLIAR